MKEFTVKFYLDDSEYMTALRLSCGAVCSLRGMDVDETEDFKVCVTESAIMLKNCGFEKAEELLKEADRSLAKAHEIQTDLIRKEASGEHQEINVIFVHAQDHLMSAMEVRTLAENFIRICRRLHRLETDRKEEGHDGE